MFFKNLLFKLIELYNFLVDPYTPKIYKVFMTYDHDGSKHICPHLTKFWRNEQNYWMRRGKGNKDYYWCDISHDYKNKQILKIPKHVGNVFFKIKYNYSGKKYICFHNKPFLEKKIDTRVKFTYPIKKVLLKNSKNSIDITTKYIKYLGPRNDFHDCDDQIQVKDLFPENFNTIEITDILNKSKTFSPTTKVHHLLV
jgi:hypothetical protein